MFTGRLSLQLLLITALLSLAGAAHAARSWTAVPYTGNSKAPLDQTLDIYQPEEFHEGRQLVVFLESAWWSSPKEPLLNEPLVRFWNSLGLTVARVRHRSGDQHPHPAQVKDVAAAVSFLMDKADRYGYRKDRIFVVGHGSGGHLVSLLGLDRQYLAAHNKLPAQLAGVVSISGIYELNPQYDMYEGQRKRYRQLFSDDEDKRRGASPMQYVDQAGPPMLILSAEQDASHFAVDARLFAKALKGAGKTYAFQRIIAGRTHTTLPELARPNNPASFVALNFFGLEGLPKKLKSLLAYEEIWNAPPITASGFWDYPELVKRYPMEDAMRNTIRRLYAEDQYRLEEWAMDHYYAVDLLHYLRLSGRDNGLQAGHLVVTNARGESLYWDLFEIARYKPMIVIGIDDEKDLFRFSTFYRLQQEYSWKPSEKQPPVMVRSLGGFIHFRRSPPLQFRPRHQAQYALTPESLTVVKKDPLAEVRGLPRRTVDVLITDNGCLSCHSFKGAGGKAHHLKARDGQPHGGNALALEQYPPEVLKTFVFDPEETAKAIGVAHRPVPEDVRDALYKLVESAR